MQLDAAEVGDPGQRSRVVVGDASTFSDVVSPIALAS